MRVKGEYISHDVLYASMGVKISAPNLEDAVAGSALYLANTEAEKEDAIKQVNKELMEVKNKVKLSDQVIIFSKETPLNLYIFPGRWCRSFHFGLPRSSSDFP